MLLKSSGRKRKAELANCSPSGVAQRVRAEVLPNVAKVAKDREVSRRTENIDRGVNDEQIK
jgi:hypothetical protein